jgi:hypothetical protein
LNAGGGHGQPEGVGTGAASDGLGYPAVAGGGLLEGADLRPKDKPLGLEDSFGGGEDLGADLGVFAGEIEQGDAGMGGGCFR